MDPLRNLQILIVETHESAVPTHNNSPATFYYRKQTPHVRTSTARRKIPRGAYSGKIVIASIQLVKYID